jgi:hypothetical protein
MFAFGGLRLVAGYISSPDLHMPNFGTMLPNGGSDNGGNNGAIGGQPSAVPSSTGPDPRLAQAASTKAGGMLAALVFPARPTYRYAATETLLGNGELETFLNRMTKGSDTYVVFRITNQPQVKDVTEGYIPDVVVSLNTGTIVALMQEFSDTRGTICFNSIPAMDITSSNQTLELWYQVNGYVRGQSLGNFGVRVGHSDVPLVPDGVDPLTCGLYSTNSG